MGYVTVKFLGEEYQVSETINEFLSYDKLLSPIRTKMLNAVTKDVKRDMYLKYDGNKIVNHIHSTSDKYRQMIEKAADLLVKRFIELGVYDVTVNDLLKDVKSIDEINILEKKTFETLLEEGYRYVDMKNAGIERAYNYAASNITGSGVRFFTSSFSDLMINSVIEKSIILSQAKKADEEYGKAVRTITKQTIFALDKLYREVMIKEFYPSIIEIFLEFDRKIMGIFLAELTIREKFDFQSVENYDMKKSEEMLKNISQISDKIGFLKQVFLICPFSVAVYKECLKRGLFDKDTFETAKYFGMGKELAEEMDNYIKDNLKNPEKIEPIISILSSHRGIDKLTIWRKIYEETLRKIEDTYRLFNSAIFDKKNLDLFIKENLIRKMSEIVEKSFEEIDNIIDKKMKDLISKKQYEEFVEIGILLPETIRMSNSSATDLSEINNEIKSALTKKIMEYIEEAKKRLGAYNQAKELFDKEIKQKERELSILKSEREKLGFFAFSKKKEIATIIASKENEISVFKKTNEPKDLQMAFEKMYG